MSTQDLLKQAFATYLYEYGEGYDRFSFLDCVAATLCTPPDAEQLLAHYRQAITVLREAFPLELETCCPNCASPTVVQRQRSPELLIWVARDWIDPSDGLERNIDHCPQCGIELLDSDECGRRIDTVICLQCGHSAQAHANADTECNGIGCRCHNFILDYESVKPW